jgi:hypothetical protein
MTRDDAKSKLDTLLRLHDAVGHDDAYDDLYAELIAALTTPAAGEDDDVERLRDYIDAYMSDKSDAALQGFRACIDRIGARLRAVPQGCVVVPREPTEEMLGAGFAVWEPGERMSDYDREMVGKTYSAMLAKASDGVASVHEIREALEDLLSAVDAHNEANGKVMVDPHSTRKARNALAAAPAAPAPEKERGR